MREETAKAVMAQPGLKTLCKAGGVTLILAVLVVLAEIAIGFFPSAIQAAQRTVTVVDWFDLFQKCTFLGLRNLGLLNLIGMALLAPAYVAMYFLLRAEKEPWAALGAVLFIVGAAVYLADYRGFEMLALSREYTLADDSAQRAALVAAGQAMLAEGSNRLGISLIDAGGLVISLAMFGGKAFGKAAAIAGIAGNGLMMAFEVIRAWMPAWFQLGLKVAMIGGVVIIAWYLMVSRRLLEHGAACTPE